MSVCVLGNIPHEEFIQNGGKFQNGGEFELNCTVCVANMLKEVYHKYYNYIIYHYYKYYNLKEYASLINY